MDLKHRDITAWFSRETAVPCQRGHTAVQKGGMREIREVKWSRALHFDREMGDTEVLWYVHLSLCACLCLCVCPSPAGNVCLSLCWRSSMCVCLVICLCTVCGVCSSVSLCVSLLSFIVFLSIIACLFPFLVYFLYLISYYYH